MREHKWERTGWWQVLAPDNSVWCETSNESEARESMREGDVLRVQLRCVAEKWAITQ